MQTTQICGESVPEYQLPEILLIKFDSEVAFRVGGNFNGYGIFRSFHVEWYWLH